MNRVPERYDQSRKEIDFLTSINPALQEFVPSGDHLSRASVIPAIDFIPAENKF